MFLLAGCGVKLNQLPFLEHPYISKMVFLKELKSDGDSLRETSFKGGIRSPFFLLIEVKEVENSHTLFIKFYNNKGVLCHEIPFEFGEQGKYYEYVIFTDKVLSLKPGTYRYGVFLDNRLLIEDRLTLLKREGKGK